MFTHVPRDPNCKVCRMTRTTHGKCKIRPLNRVDAIPASNSLVELISTEHKILNLDDESRRIGYRVIPRKGKIAHETHRLVGGDSYVQKAGQDLHSQFTGVCQSVSGLAMDA